MKNKNVLEEIIKIYRSIEKIRAYHDNVEKIYLSPEFYNAIKEMDGFSVDEKNRSGIEFLFGIPVVVLDELSGYEWLVKIGAEKWQVIG